MIMYYAIQIKVVIMYFLYNYILLGIISAAFLIYEAVQFCYLHTSFNRKLHYIWR